MAETALLTKQDLPDIIQRYLAGESLQAIAKDSAVHVRTLYRWMLSGCGDDQYQQLVTNCLVNRVADADEALATGEDACQIARAREQARFARMDLERRRPHLYGPKTEVKQDHKISITIEVLPPTPQPVVIEADVTTAGDAGVE